MDEIQLHPFILPALITLLLLWSVAKRLNKSSGKKNLPPSPPKLPILGNLHQLGTMTHQKLHSFAQKYGPLMFFDFGSMPVLIVSSADAAHEIMRTHDVAFADRPDYMIIRKITYDRKDVALAPYTEYWRKLKSMLVLRVLTSKRVQSSHHIRDEETAVLVKKIRESSGPVNLTKMFSELTNNGICRSAFGRKYNELVDGKKFLLMVEELSAVTGTYSIGDFIPWLSWVNRLSGYDQRVDKLARGFDDFLESVIEERLANREKKSFQHENGENFLDIMLEFYNANTGDLSIDRDSIKAIILDIFVAGTDTTSVALEWAMAELLHHPTVMKKLQEEVREIVKDKQDITHEDLEKMRYLKAVIKESFRLHPPVPLLLPRLARRDVKVKGYDIPAGTMVLTNSWAIGRDPASWDEPDEFKPARLLNSSVDFRGLDFQLIPFGAGKRACPGISYSAAVIELVLANLVQKFNWKLPHGAEGKDMDMRECPGLSVHKLLPLLAVATEAK